MRRLVPERLCLMLGSALVLAAVCLYVYDRLEDARAGAQAALAVSQLRQSQSIAAVSETEQPADSAESLPTEDAESESESASETPASSIEREYLGVLTIPALGLELPVQTSRAGQIRTFSFYPIGGQSVLKSDGLGAILVVECNQHPVIVQENGIHKNFN